MNRSHVQSVLVETAADLLGYFLHRTTDPQDAADLVGETLSEAWRVARRMPDDSEIARMWLFGVARNILRHHVRGRIRRDALVSTLGHTISDVTADTLDQDLDVRLALTKISAGHAELVRLVHWDGFTLEQAAAHLGIPASTARSRYARAKELLRTHLTITVDQEAASSDQ